MTSIPTIVLALAAAVATALLVSLAVGRRGGRFRGLPGWALFWVFFAPLLVALSRLRRPIALPALGLFMFVGMREYFFLAPLRPRDRYALLLAYLAIPLVLWPLLRGRSELFLVVSPLLLFVLLPLLLVAGAPQGGTFESTGRLFVGLLSFVFCAAHLGLMTGSFGRGEIELFGALVLAAELPFRLVRRSKAGSGVFRAVAGLAAGAGLAALVGALLGGLVGMSRGHGAAAGAIVAVATAGGAFLAEASAQDLNLGAPASRMGRGALLDRTLPALFAAPVYFHFATRVLASP